MELAQELQLLLEEAKTTKMQIKRQKTRAIANVINNKRMTLVNNQVQSNDLVVPVKQPSYMKREETPQLDEPDFQRFSTQPNLATTIDRAKKEREAMLGVEAGETPENQTPISGRSHQSKKSAQK